MDNETTMIEKELIKLLEGIINRIPSGYMVKLFIVSQLARNIGMRSMKSALLIRSDANPQKL